MVCTAQGRRLRIAYIVGAFPSISETFVLNQIAGVAARGHEVDIYTTAETITPLVSGEVEQYRLLGRTQPLMAPAGWRGMAKSTWLFAAVGLRAPRFLVRVLAILWRNDFTGARRLLHASLSLIHRNVGRYDVIHAQFGPLGVFAAQLIEIGVLRGPIVTSFRGYDLGKYLRDHSTAYRDLFDLGALFLPVSRTLAKRLIDAGCERKKIRVHHSGVSCRRLCFRENRPSDGRVRIVTVARLVEKKGIPDAIRAVAQLHGEGKQVSYTVIGDGPRRSDLEQLVHSLDVRGCVRFAGAKSNDEVLDIVNAAHILLAPSVTATDGDEEGIPNALKEAMAMGLPVIATRHGGIPELVEDGISGLLVPERSPKLLADRLRYLIDHPQTWTNFGRAGRQRVEAEYDIDRLNDELVVLYGQAAERDVQALGEFRAGGMLAAASSNSPRRT